MKILVIDGCGRKGNTWSVVECAMNEIKEKYPDVEFEKLELAKINLPFCIGCSNCFRLGHEKCPHYTIMNGIIQKIENADGVIICSTTYNWSETGYVKNLFDHLCFMLHRPYFYKEKALVITTAGGTGQKKAAKRIASTLRGIGFNRCYNIALASVSWNAYTLNDKHKKIISNKAIMFARDVASKKLHSPRLLNIIPYNIMRGMGQNYAKDSEYPTEDGVWWTDPERSNSPYFPQIKMSLFKKVFGNMFFVIGKKLGSTKKMLITYKR